VDVIQTDRFVREGSHPAGLCALRGTPKRGAHGSPLIGFPIPPNQRLSGAPTCVAFLERPWPPRPLRPHRDGVAQDRTTRSSPPTCSASTSGESAAIERQMPRRDELPPPPSALERWLTDSVPAAIPSGGADGLTHPTDSSSQVAGLRLAGTPFTPFETGRSSRTAVNPIRRCTRKVPWVNEKAS
jgi:hypothetical protein